jgi:uncharacterized protein
MSVPENIEWIDAEEEAYLFTQTSQIPKSGKGLFTAIDIFKGEIISIFDGEIIDEDETNSRFENNKGAYFIGMLDGRIMDSMHIECFAKYANDARGISLTPFTNNAIITILDNNQIALVATKKIKANMEIFCAYGKAYWKQILADSKN